MALDEGAPSAGALLREWRERRKLTQRELASQSAVSARHLSFIETGRARPSREMVLHLAERLEVPLRERNRLLLAAGFELLAYAGISTALSRAHPPTPHDIMLVHELRLDDTDFAFFGTFTTFGTARDLTLSELTILAVYPANSETAMRLTAAVSETQID
jgi:transcriptional regulator with XRE-family HTH domain